VHTFILLHCSVLHFQGMSLPQSDVLERFEFQVWSFNFIVHNVLRISNLAS
jgi:hypothetical protein